MRTLLRRLWVEEEGQTLVEYALIVALVSIALIALINFMSGRIGKTYGNIGNTLPNQ